MVSPTTLHSIPSKYNHDLRPVEDLDDDILTYHLVDPAGKEHTITCSFQKNTWGALRQIISKIYSEHSEQCWFMIPTEDDSPMVMNVNITNIDSSLLKEYKCLFPQKTTIIEIL